MITLGGIAASKMTVSFFASKSSFRLAKFPIHSQFISLYRSMINSSLKLLWTSNFQNWIEELVKKMVLNSQSLGVIGAYFL